MKAKLILLAAMLVCAALPAAAQNERQVVKSKSNITNNRNRFDPIMIDLEKKAWKNLVDKKYEDFGKGLADDYQSVYGKVRNTKESELAGVRLTTFKSAEVTDANVQWVNDDTAIVTALVKAETAGTDGVFSTTTFRTASVMVKRSNAWLCVFHTDEPLETKK